MRGKRHFCLMHFADLLNICCIAAVVELTQPICNENTKDINSSMAYAGPFNQPACPARSLAG